MFLSISVVSPFFSLDFHFYKDKKKTRHFARISPDIWWSLAIITAFLSRWFTVLTTVAACPDD